MDIFEVKLIFEMSAVRGQQHSNSTHERMFLWKCRSFLERKCVNLGGVEPPTHYNDVIMGAIASQITSLTIVYSTDYSDVDQRKHQSSAPVAFVWGIHRGPVNSPHRWPVTRKMFPFDDVIMLRIFAECFNHLSYRGQTFAVPCVWIMALADKYR